jgi:uncharacterized membrane protein
MKTKPWQFYAIITTVTWGLWGAVMEFPAKWGFPETLGYVVWSLTMIPCALIALYNIDWKLEYDRRSILLGSIIGLFGAGGQLILFKALREGPAYIIFPLISLYPILTVALSVWILKETSKPKTRLGIVLALLAIGLLSYQPPSESQSSGHLWILLSTMVFVLWGLQAFVMKFSNDTMKAESIFFYMMFTAVLLAPVAWLMTDFSQPVEWGLKGPWLSALIQSLNAVGAIFLVYALRYGKAIIVVPMTSLAPVITVLLSLILYQVIPHWVVAAGLVTASFSIYLLSLE